jgi:KUP system potassium uptake protein
VLRDPSAIANPFYRLFPPELLVPMVVLATIATIIASQAVITGDYSVTRQAIKLDDRFNETNPIGCHHSSLVSLACRSYILVMRSWSEYDSNHGIARLGLIPRLTIRHTSEMHEGQIYIPRANSAVLIGVLLLVAIFHTSDALASAYGVAVTTTMVVDGVLGFIVIWKAWGWRPWAAAIMMVPLISVDAIFLSSNLLKIF